ncbi:hypothetical protein ABZT03_38850 [Streptomyces sp. NPDC005574]|uniref:hypothetical protein n=1 Tax=Streptomyces sp. NPDC005574 TaxID=3156891 RepID=UPI0033BA35EF
MGRVVHYRSFGTPGGEYASECRAAVVTEVPQYLTQEPMDGCPNGTDGEWIASLAVLGPSGTFFDRNVRQDEDSRDGGTWHWPERTD